MVLHIISDNPLFLFGISEKTNEELPNPARLSIKIHYSNFSEKEIDENDCILICIYNKAIRMHALKRIVKISSNIAIMVDSIFEQEMTSTYPMRVCKKITFSEILCLEKKMKRQPPPLKVCDHTYNIFADLYNGGSIRAIVEKKELNIITVYSLKQRIFKKFGLNNINDKGIIHCMEYLEINRRLRKVMGKEPAYALPNA